MRTGDVLQVTTTELAPTGEGVAAEAGVAVHAFDTFPGESAEVRVEHVSRQQPRAHARLVRLLAPHPERRARPCPHSERDCTGCPLQAIGASAQREAKRELLARRYGLAVDAMVAGPEWGYRWSSKRVVGGTSGHVIVGSFVRGSHALAAMDDCRVDHPAIAAAARELQSAASALGVVPFDERTGEGDLRYAWFKTDGDAVLLTLITARRESAAAERLPGALKLPAGVAWSVQPGRGNAVRGDAPTHLAGAPSLAVELAGVRVEVGPLGFLQPNPRVAELAYLDLVAGAQGEPLTGGLAFDLYAGAGVTTALLRRGFAEVRPCEAYPESAARLGVAAETAEQFLAREHSARPELVVANPPRGGMGPAVCAALGELAAPRLQIMSCSPEALARDLAALSASGYRLVRARAYDTLPQTPHVEVVAWLERG